MGRITPINILYYLSQLLYKMIKKTSEEALRVWAHPIWQHQEPNHILIHPILLKIQNGALWIYHPTEINGDWLS